jgi:pimeloyl-ACP methyl ester carboxylesterase
MTVVPFSLPFSHPAVEDLRDRLRRTRWFDDVAGSAWAYGFDRRFLQDICAYWRDVFEWKAQVDRLSSLHHYRLVSDGVAVHFIHERGKGPNPVPLILTHGWPGSFLEMIDIIPLLTDPAAHGGDARDSFDVIVPSLPGFGYSDCSVSGMNAFRIADLWVQLMDQLGYSRFAAQGGDLGAGVSTALGLRHPDRIIGIHLNFIPGSYRPFLKPGTKLGQTEEAFLANAERWSQDNGAYAHIQRTRPQTAAFGLNDSPVGLAAWILEKFREWSDCEGELYSRFSRDELLTNVSLYWMTQTIFSSFCLYYEGRIAPLQFEEGSSIRVPCAFAHFPKEIIFPPREWVERGYNVQRWTQMHKGGHFAAAEEPELLCADIRAFFRDYRNAANPAG